MNLSQRINLMVDLGQFMQSEDETWQAIRTRASQENPWFIPTFIDRATTNIAQTFLQRENLETWVSGYDLPADNPMPVNIGIVMAGNIPMVGFHDFLCAFITGHRQTIKASSRDNRLLPFLVEKMQARYPVLKEELFFSDMLKGCDAYIATGSNNSARYFEYYFDKYPHIIRRNRTSVAVLTGTESRETLELLADDVYLYYGLGCRNVTKIYVPENYDFQPLLEAFRKYNYFSDNNRYKNNYDYQLALLILNKKTYMSNESILLAENPSFFSPISVLHYEYYRDWENVLALLQNNSDIQCVIGEGGIPFGRSQYPSLMDYPDGVDTLQFLRKL